ncbi:MAG: hypothetical protein AAFO95_19845, partial [Cyanobacteria bacterium J06600_6]
MKSAKVINKILLISLAFGSVTFVAGMFAEGNLKKTLIGLGATTSVASLAGTVVTSGKSKAEDEQNEIQYEDIQVADPVPSKEDDAAADQASEKIQAFEADINSFQAQPNQLFDIASDLSSETQDLEKENDIPQQDIETTDTKTLNTENLELEDNSPSFEIPEQNIQSQKLEETISPIEESFEDSKLEEISQETFDNEQFIAQNSEEEVLNNVDKVEENLNPFASSSDSSESEQQEETADLEIVDKIFGAFDPSESEDSSEFLVEEDSAEVISEELINTIESDSSGEFNSESESEELSFETEPVDELETESDSPDEFNFESESAIAPES